MASVVLDTKVQVGAGRRSGRAHIAHDLTGGNSLTGLNHIVGHVQVLGFKAVLMINSYIVAGDIVIAGNGNHTGTGSNNRCTLRACQVYAIVENDLVIALLSFDDYLNTRREIAHYSTYLFENLLAKQKRMLLKPYPLKQEEQDNG